MFSSKGFLNIPKTQVMSYIHGEEEVSDPKRAAFIIPMVEMKSEVVTIVFFLNQYKPFIIDALDRVPIKYRFHRVLTGCDIWGKLPPSECTLNQSCAFCKTDSYALPALIDPEVSHEMLDAYVYDAAKWGAPVTLALEPLQQRMFKNNPSGILKLWMDAYVSSLFRLCEAALNDIKKTTTEECFTKEVETWTLGLFNVFIQFRANTNSDDRVSKASMVHVSFVGLARRTYVGQDHFLVIESLIDDVLNRLESKKDKICSGDFRFSSFHREVADDFNDSLSLLRLVKDTVTMWRTASTPERNIISCLRLVKDASTHLLDAWKVKRPCPYVWWMTDQSLSMLKSAYSSETEISHSR